MIAVDIEKARKDAAQLRGIAEKADNIAYALNNSCTEHISTWKGSAGNAFQELSGRLYAQILSFGDEINYVSDDILQICVQIEAAENKK